VVTDPIRIGVLGTYSTGKTLLVSEDHALMARGGVEDALSHGTHTGSGPRTPPTGTWPTGRRSPVAAIWRPAADVRRCRGGRGPPPAAAPLRRPSPPQRNRLRGSWLLPRCGRARRERSARRTAVGLQDH
jgi:hypothetical protein